MTLTETALTPFATGYGRVMAEDTWSAISQVNGRAIVVSDALSVGSILPVGSQIIGVDPRDYEIGLARATVSRDSAFASLQELDATETNTRASIELERRIETIRKGELDRQMTLLERGNVAQTRVDTSIRDLLAQERAVLNLENALRLLPSQRASLEATISTRIVEIEEAERALQNTTISTPLTGRVTAKSVSPGQFVRVGDTLATIESTSASEVVPEFQTRVLGNLFSVLVDDSAQADMTGLDQSDAFALLKRLNLTAEVRLQSGEQSFFWPAKLVRFDGSVDATTGTVGLVVRIEDPSQPDPNRRGPPLTNGSFVEVTLIAPAPVIALRIPRDAIHRDADAQFVYVVDAETRLTRKDVVIGAAQDDMVVARSGLNKGNRIVLSDPRPAVIGMLLDPIDAAAVVSK